MSKPLSVQEVEGRLQNYPRENYLFMGSVLKGVALSVATLALAEIWTNYRSEWMLFLPWLTSLTAILVSYMTWGRGIVLTNSKANMRDSVFPLLMGIVEFSLFGILLKVQDHPHISLNWFACLGMHPLLGFFLVHNRLTQTSLSGDFEPPLRTVGEKYMEWMRKDRLGAGIVAIAAFVVWYLIRWVAFPRLSMPFFGVVQSIAACIFLLIFWMVAHAASKQRQEIDVDVTKALLGREIQAAQKASPSNP